MPTPLAPTVNCRPNVPFLNGKVVFSIGGNPGRAALLWRRRAGTDTQNRLFESCPDPAWL
jgi:hypothetical protein